MNLLTRILGRAAALGLLAGLLALLWAFVAVPLARRVEATREALAQNAEVIARLERGIAGGEDYGAEIARLTETIGRSGIYVRADTEPLAAAKMQEHLKSVLARHGGELRSVQSLPTSEEDGLVRIGLRAMMTARYASLVRALHDLETGEPFLFVDNLEIKPLAARRRGAADDAVDQTTAVFDLFAYMPPEVGP